MSHPLFTILYMESIFLISALALALLAAIGFALAWERQRRSRQNSDPAIMLERVIGVADRTFQAHLETGKAQLEHQRDALDQKWDRVTSEVHQELAELRHQFAELQRDRAAQHAGLTETLRNATEQQARLHSSTEKLNNILANSQARGQWGERMAEDILRAIGMIEGIHYSKQETTAAGTRPDFSFHLPDGRKLHMDVKFPLDSYARYVEASSELEQHKARKDFGRAVRDHVKALASRDAYLDSTETVGYVLMFIPNDGIYAFILEHHREVFDKAQKNKVVICAPSTLYAMLALVRQAMDTLAMERSSQEILDHLGSFTDQWQDYVKQFDLVGKHLGTLNSAFDKLSTTRRNQLERELDRIEQLKTHSDQKVPATEPLLSTPELIVG